MHPQYVAKCEPVASMEVDEDLADALGLNEGDPLARDFISTYISRPVLAPEAAWNLLGYPIIENDAHIVSIILSSPGERAHLKTRASHTFITSVDLCRFRPSVDGVPEHDFSNRTIYEYFQRYTVGKAPTRPATPVHLRRDNSGIDWPLQDMTGNHWVSPAPNNHCARFTHPSPSSNTEEYFYTVLMRYYKGRDDTELLTGTNTSYVTECAIRNLWRNEDDLAGLLEPHYRYQLCNHRDLTRCIQTIIMNHPVPSTDATGGLVVPPAAIELDRPPCSEFQHLDDLQLTPQQQRFFDMIVNAKTGMYWLGGVLGAGKSLLIKKLIRYLDRLQKHSLLLSASTGAAATLLSTRARTVHSAYAVPGRGHALTPLSPNDSRFVLIAASDVFIIDEHSMLTAADFNIVMTRICRIVDPNHPLAVLQERLIIMVGDAQQLPPVCYCNRTRGDAPIFCARCHISSSFWWRQGTHLQLTESVRQQSDPDWNAFLNIIRVRKPTDDEIHDALFQCFVTEAEAISLIETDPSCTILCTHHIDVEKFNTIALRANLQDAAAVPVGLFVKTRGDVQNVAAWINEQKFRRFHSVALGARVMLTSNVNVEKGLTNGAIGVVRALRYDTHPDTGEQYLRTIRVEFTAHAGQSVSINVTRSVVQETYRDGVSFQKSTFPLQLAYAFTGHKAQVCIPLCV